MRSKYHFLITGLGALALCSGAALAAAQQDESQQPSPETAAPESTPQSMPPEQSNMEGQMLTRGAAERRAQEQDETSPAPSSQQHGVTRNYATETPKSSTIPQPVYPQQTEDALAGSAAVTTTSEASAAMQSGAPSRSDAQAAAAYSQSGTSSESAASLQSSADSQSRTSDEALARNPSNQAYATAQEPSPTLHEDQSLPPERTSTQDETTLARSSSSQAATTEPPTASEQPVQSESAMDQNNTQLPDSSASVQAKFDALDTDHDGTIDRQEAQASDVLSAQFNTLDTRGDGKLTLAEFTTATNLASIRVDRKVHQE